MKITEIGGDTIYFDNGYKIETEGVEDCCAVNYADLDQIEEIAKTFEFDSETFCLEDCDCGFRFGDSRRKFFVPCYSWQNGYYSDQTMVRLRDGNNNIVMDIMSCGEMEDNGTYLVFPY